MPVTFDFRLELTGYPLRGGQHLVGACASPPAVIDRDAALRDDDIDVFARRDDCLNSSLIEGTPLRIEGS